MTRLRGRGLVWVVVQSVLMAGIVGAAWLPPRWPEASRGVLRALGAICAFAGVALAGWAARTLGRALSPLPVPSARARLVTGGPFRLVRHPVYSGLLLFFAGLALATSVPALAATAVLAAWWTAKARVEEAALARRFPEYDEYRQRVRGGLVPRR